jgi:4-hydroxy-tetrahydrodipicolinate synthase
MRRMVDEPERRAEIEADLQDVYTALGVGPAAMTTKAALNMLGHPVGKPRLPLVEADEAELSVIRSALAAHGMLERASA